MCCWPGGTTNAFIAQELLGDKSIEPGLCTVGNSTDGCSASLTLQPQELPQRIL